MPNINKLPCLVSTDSFSFVCYFFDSRLHTSFIIRMHFAFVRTASLTVTFSMVSNPTLEEQTKSARYYADTSYLCLYLL